MLVGLLYFVHSVYIEELLMEPNIKKKVKNKTKHIVLNKKPVLDSHPSGTFINLFL